MLISRVTALQICLIGAVFLNVFVWLSARDQRAQWLNVPSAPARHSTTMLALGDQQLAYRAIGVMLQNLGDTGGRATALKTYNYKNLKNWLFLSDKLDAQSNFTPFIAAFYFGSVQDSQKLSYIVDFLEHVGQRAGGERWRWLAQAVYIARWEMKDLDRALYLAQILANLDEPGLPLWTKQMPAFVLNAQGNKEEAAAIMFEILKTSAEGIHPNEVNYTRDYICTRILDETEAAKREICQNIP